MEFPYGFFARLWRFEAPFGAQLGAKGFPKSICWALSNPKIYKNDLNSTLPEEVELINGKDKYLLPGLIDGHCHSSFDEVSSNDELFYHRNRPGLAAIIASTNLNKILQSGVTSICDPDSIHELGYDLKDLIRAEHTSE